MDQHDYILKLVEEAREYARVGNFELCSNHYIEAKAEIQSAIQTCRNKEENYIWNNLIKDIVLEESSIRRIRNIVDDIVKVVNVADAKRQAKIAEAASKAERDSRPDFVVTAAGKKQNYVLSKRRGMVSKVQKTSKQKKSPPKSDHRSPRHAQNLPSPNNENSSVLSSIAQNPLIKQIIDMGILIQDPNIQWESIAGLDSIKRLLRQNLVILPMRPDIARGLLAPWRSVLFYGPPGNGKTFLAKAIATECKRTFFNITSATITSKFLGESEKLVSFLFQVAEQMAPSTIFFDEIDSLCSQRGTQGETEASRKIKTELLTRLEGIDSCDLQQKIFVLAATNFPWDLDEALLRRFQKRVYIPLPDFEGRVHLLKMQIDDMTDETFDFVMWAQELNGYSCGDIANLCHDAAQICFNKKLSELDTNSWQNVPADQAQVIISNEVFSEALKNRKPSVDPSTISRYLEWKQQKGAE